jgi:hypothetical protein
LIEISLFHSDIILSNGSSTGKIGHIDHPSPFS